MGTQAMTMLVLDGSPSVDRLQQALAKHDVEIEVARTFTDASAALESRPFDAVVASVSHADVARLRSALREERPDLPFIGTGAAEAPAGLLDPNDDFLRTPLDEAELTFVVQKTAASAEHAELAMPRVDMSDTLRMLGKSPEMTALQDMVRRASQTSANVLIRGESGSGKEVVARSIHETSTRARSPFVKVHCAALPDNLLESELFGYEKGAFTGAAARKLGRLDLAEDGTLFLDEIGDISATTQVKLLRVLQDREYERVGGTKTLPVRARFVTATHRNLEDMVKKGDFREDLYYRLNVIPIAVPPLRKRRADIALLAEHFCQLVCARQKKKPVRLSPDAVEALERHPWPGNVRQLENLIERLVVLHDEPTLEVRDVNEELGREFGAGSPAADAPTDGSVTGLIVAVERAEKAAIQKALTRAKGNRALAARLLGVSVRTLFYKLKEHDIG